MGFLIHVPSILILIHGVVGDVQIISLIMGALSGLMETLQAFIMLNSCMLIEEDLEVLLPVRGTLAMIRLIADLQFNSLSLKSDLIFAKPNDNNNKG